MKKGNLKTLKDTVGIIAGIALFYGVLFGLFELGKLLDNAPFSEKIIQFLNTIGIIDFIFLLFNFAGLIFIFKFFGNRPKLLATIALFYGMISFFYGVVYGVAILRLSDSIWGWGKLIYFLRTTKILDFIFGLLNFAGFAYIFEFFGNRWNKRKEELNNYKERKEIAKNWRKLTPEQKKWRVSFYKESYGEESWKKLLQEWNKEIGAYKADPVANAKKQTPEEWEEYIQAFEELAKEEYQKGKQGYY